MTEEAILPSASPQSKQKQASESLMDGITILNKDRVNAGAIFRGRKEEEEEEAQGSTAVSLTDGSSRRSSSTQEGDSKVYFCI